MMSVITKQNQSLIVDYKVEETKKVSRLNKGDLW